MFLKKYRNKTGLRHIMTSVADPHHFDADPNPAFHFDADPDPTFHSDADPETDPTTHFFSRFRSYNAPK
jgi:hypothetical protein